MGEISLNSTHSNRFTRRKHELEQISTYNFPRLLCFERCIKFPLCLQCLPEATYLFSRCLEVSRRWFSLICRKWSGSVSTMNRFECVESARIWLAPKFGVSWPESISEGQTYHDSGWTKRSRCRELDWTTLKNSLGYVTDLSQSWVNLSVFCVKGAFTADTPPPTS